MAVRVTLTFDTPHEGLAATSLARLLCDLQHLSLVLVASQVPDAIKFSPALYETVFQKYSLFVDSRPGAFGWADITIVHLRQESPLEVGFLSKVPRFLSATTKRLWEGVGFLLERTTFYDEAKARRQLQNELLEQEVIAKKIKNFDALLKSSQKLDEPIRERFINSARGSFFPFLTDHPQLLQARAEEVDDPMDDGREGSTVEN